MAKQTQQERQKAQEENAKMNKNLRDKYVKQLNEQTRKAIEESSKTKIR